ncbi:MAG: hypothetical protein WCQ91_07395 [Planctomycetota bacterium]
MNLLSNRSIRDHFRSHERFVARLMLLVLLAMGLAAAGESLGQAIDDKNVARSQPQSSPTPPKSTPTQRLGEPQVPRRGGLVPPQRSVPGPTESIGREELVRRYDLNADGRIDESEAEMARSKMRRERAERSRHSGLNPLTGRPRSEKANPNVPQLGDRDRAARENPLQQNPVQPRPTQPAGSTAHTTLNPGSELLLVPGRPDGAPRKTDGVESRPGLSPSTASSPRATRQTPAATQSPAQPRSSVITGGVRAGAPAVRPGYGAPGAGTDLNAGRLPGGLPSAQGRPAQGQASPKPLNRPSLFPQGPARGLTGENDGR